MIDVEKSVPSEIAEAAKINMSQWLSSLETKDPQKVAELYAENATFLPTVSGDFKRGRVGVKEYFVHFLPKNPKGRVVKDVITPIGEDAYLHCGMYDFDLDAGGGKRATVQARFDYLWKRNNGRWEIAHHHSSIRP